MSVLTSFRDGELYFHHSLDEQPDPENFPIHAHNAYEIFYFLSDEGSFLVEGTTYDLHRYDILIMRPAETHRLFIPPEHPYERKAIHFPESASSPDTDLLLIPFRDRRLGQHNRYAGAEHPELRRTLEDLHLRPGLERIQLNAHLQLFLTELYAVWELETGSQQGVTLGDSSAGVLAGEVLRYVNRHLFEPISLQVLSDRFDRSPSQISRIFVRATGTTFWKYVVIKRLLTARAMLQRGQSATETCFACGFSDYSSFYRA